MAQLNKLHVIESLSYSRRTQQNHNSPRPGEKWKRYLLLFVAGIACVGLSRCAAKRLRADYTGYESAFAETSNREMLLNLARLNQHDPTYFFKMGQMATSYRMQAALSGTGSYVPQGTNLANVIGGGTPSMVFEQDPSFTFIPVNDDATAQLLLKPIPAELFYALYQQGWRADQLFRLMVDRIEFRDPSTKVWQIIRNTPAANNAPDYTRFLRVSALAYELQKRGYLLLRGRKEFVPLARAVQLKEAPAAKDILDAQAKNLIWRLEEDGQWELGQENVTPRFEMNEPSEAQVVEDMPELGRGGIAGATALSTMFAILQNGFTIEESFSSTEPAEDTKGVSCHLVMRSLIGLMTAAAQEQDGFDELIEKNPVIPPSDSNTLHFKNAVPAFEQRPILRVAWKPDDGVIPLLVQLAYGNKKYMVTDKSEPRTAEDSSWNRNVFRLIAQLTAQVTVDISKFPLPQILQLHTD
jgi:hypothetical protein